MDGAERQRLAGLLHREDDELLELLAAEQFGDELGALPERDRRERAARWLERFVADRRDALCAHPAVVALFDQAQFDELEEAAVIADALASATGSPKGLTLTVAAVLLARRGLRAICLRG